MPNDSKPIVLVADDEPSMVAMLSSHLRSKGYTVLEANDGDQAWELAHEHLPNLVLLDVMMPGMSGWEVCRKIREAVSLAHTGVIMLTGIGENLNEMTSPLYGADAYLDKPFEFSDLDEKIAETLARRSAGALGRADEDESDEDESDEDESDEDESDEDESDEDESDEDESDEDESDEDPAGVKQTLRPARKPKGKGEVAEKPLQVSKPALAKAALRPAPKAEKLEKPEKAPPLPKAKAPAKPAPLPKAKAPAKPAPLPKAKAPAKPAPLPKPAAKSATKATSKVAKPIVKTSAKAKASPQKPIGKPKKAAPKVAPKALGKAAPKVVAKVPAKGKAPVKPASKAIAKASAKKKR